MPSWNEKCGGKSASSLTDTELVWSCTLVDPKDKMADGQPCAFCDFRYNSKASPLYIKQHMIDIKEGDYLMNRPRQVRPCKPIAAKRAEHVEADVQAAAYALSPQFCRNEFDDTVAESLGKVMADFAQAPGCKFSLDDLTEQYDAFVTALKSESNRFDDKCIKRPGTGDLLVDGAFTTRSLEKTPTQWIQTFMKPWPALKWMSLKIANMPTSASFCEHAWSIEAWMHSKRRNRLTQPLVEKLVRGHGNYIFMEHEEAKKENRIIWDVELEAEEPMSEEETRTESSDDSEDDEMESE